MPSRNSRNLKVFLPSDLLRNITTIEQKTLLLGDLSRYFAIYKVDQINVYDIPDNWKEKGFELMLIEDILNYQMTPQYLRKYRFERRRTLSAVGLLHPLNTPNHPVEKDNIEILLENDGILYRQGNITKISKNMASIDIGLKNPLEMPVNTKLEEGQMVDLRISRSGGHIEATIEEKNNIPLYWGYVINIVDTPILEIIKILRTTDTTIATSKYGKQFMEILRDKEMGAVNGKNAVSLFFGPRSRGLMEFFTSIESFFESFDHVINFFYDPGTKSVRLEEAIPICLSLMRFLL